MNQDQNAANDPMDSAGAGAEPASAGTPWTIKLFIGFLMLACVALSVVMQRLKESNAVLRQEITRLAESLGNGSLPPGEILPELTSFGPSPEPIKDAPPEPMKFDDGRTATVLFVHSAACGSCDAEIPKLMALAAAHRRGGLEFVGVQSDATGPAELKHTEMNFPLRGVPGAERSWLRRVPLVPAVLIVDHEGTLRAGWYGVMNARQEAQLAQELQLAAQGYEPSPAKK